MVRLVIWDASAPIMTSWEWYLTQMEACEYSLKKNLQVEITRRNIVAILVDVSAVIQTWQWPENDPDENLIPNSNTGSRIMWQK